MSAPAIWILVPGALAVVLILLYRWERTTIFIGTITALVLAWSAWKIPIEKIIEIGPWTLKISDTFWVLGRRFTLVNEDLPLLMLIYLGAAFWFGGGYTARAGKLFVPLGMGIIALLTATLAVEPFLYAALFIEMASLMCIPLLSPPGKPVRGGVVRFLTFQTLGMPFLLFAGWMLTVLETDPSRIEMKLFAAIMLVLGFSFLLAIFPFHTWVPMVAEESHPYVAGFVLFILPGIISLFGLTFLERYSWLRESATVYTWLRVAGGLMVFTGGAWAVFQHHLGRILGYSVMLEIGWSLLAIGINERVITSASGAPLDLTLFTALFVIRFIGLGLWSLALSAIWLERGNLSFGGVQGLGRRMPFVTASLFLANLSLVGFPLLAGFTLRLVLWEQLAQVAPIIAFWTILGVAGLLAGGIRSLTVLVMSTEERGWQITEGRAMLFLLSVATFALILAGIFPRL